MASNELNLFRSLESQGEVDLFPKRDQRETLSVSHLDYLAKMYAASSPRSDEDVFNDIQLGFLPQIEEEARFGNQILIDNKVRREIEVSDIPDVKDKPRVYDAVNNSVIPELDTFIFNPDTNDLVDETAQLFSHKMETFKRLLVNKLEESSGGFWNSVGYFLDTVASDPVDIVTGGGFTRANMIDRVVMMASNPDMGDKDFVEKSLQMINEAADRGLFSEDNPFYTLQMLENLESGPALDKMFTIVGGATLGVGLLPKRLLGAVDSVDALTLLKPREEVANQLIRASGLEQDTSVDTARHLAPASQRPGDPTRFWFASPDATALRNMEVGNTTSEIVNGLDWGHFVQPEVWEAKKLELSESILKEVTETGNNRYITHSIDLGPAGNNPVVTMIYGKAKGGYFASESSANKLAEELGGEVFPRVENGKTVYGVSVSDNIPTKDLFNATSENELNTHFLQRIGSPMLTTSYRLDAILKRAEGQTGTIHSTIIRKYKKLRGKVPSKDLDFIKSTYLSLRDGAESIRREALSKGEFISRYKRAFGVNPSSKTVEFHDLFQEMNDAAYFTHADPLFKEAVNRGERILLTGENTTHRVMATKLDEIADDDVILNIDTNKTIRKSETDGLSVFTVQGRYHQTNGPSVGFIATTKPKTRKLYHSDVLGYNPGGPRVNDEFNFFLKQENDIFLPKFAQSGKLAEPLRMPGNPTTFLGGRTQKEIIKARDSIALLFNALRKEFGLVDDSMFNNLQILRSLNDDKDLTRLIRENNAWNKEIETPSELADFIERYGLHVNKDVVFSVKDEPIRQMENGTDLHSFVGGFSKRGETQQEQYVRMANGKHRRDVPLQAFGGQTAHTLDPLEASERNFTKAINMKKNQAYNFNAVNGWLKGAERYILNPEELKDLRPFERLQKARLSGVKESRLFEQERRIIERRIDHKSGFVRQWEDAIQQMSDFVYDKGWQKTGIALKNQFSTDPTIALRSIAFDLKLGLFAFPQLLVQSNQAINVIAIGGRNGLKGAASMMPLRIALHNGNESVARAIGKSAGPFIGLNEDQFVDLVRFIKKSGRDNVNSTIIEQAQDFTFGLGAVNKVRQAGRIFFNEGEKLPRLAAATTAYLEFLKKFPGQSLSSPKAELWMANRMDILTASMTKASAASWQESSFLSIPLQFMSYTSRMMEQIFVSGKILTPDERFRLGAIQLSLWGLSGLGMGSFLNWMVDEGQLEVDNDGYTLMRYGLLDYIIGNTTGARTAFGERLSFGEGFYDIYKKITEEQFLEVIGGPSASVTGDVYSGAMFLLGDAIHGRADMVNYDTTRFIRSLSSVNTVYNSWRIFKYGQYTSRNGDVLADKLGTSEAFFNLLGAPLQEVSNAYDVSKRNSNIEENLRKEGERLQEMMVVAEQKYKDGDTSGGEAILRDIGFSMRLLDPYERNKIEPFLKVPSMTVLERVIRKAMEEGASRRIVDSTFLDKENLERKRNQ